VLLEGQEGRGRTSRGSGRRRGVLGVCSPSLWVRVSTKGRVQKKERKLKGVFVHVDA